MKTTLQRWGNSQGIRIPKAIVELVGFKTGADVEISVSSDNSQITITPSEPSRPVRGRHRIEDLVASSSPDAFQGEADWSEAQGNEAW